MATENSNYSAPVESVDVVEDVQAKAIENLSAEGVEQVAPASEVSEEDAVFDAEQAGLSLGEEIAEEMLSDDVKGGDVANMSKQELVSLFASLLESEPVHTLRKKVEAIKIAFYKQHRAEVDAARKAFEAENGEEAEFTPAADALEIELKELFKEYRSRRDSYIADLDKIKEENLKIKLAIIEELKELVNSDETINTTFAKFRELQQRWKDTGVVPQAQVKDLWETYNLHVENFYNFIKINKELRDLDLKKNYEAKLSLCEQAEALIMEPSIIDAFHKLQKLHDEWRETGPVANEFKEQLWERFKDASSRINKQHQEYFDAIKREQTRNLELKTELCEKTEALIEQPFTSRKEWNKASEQLLDIQKIWRTIGFAPKKDNTRIYERFRTACDGFFAAKREFYAGIKSEMEHNLQLKTEICEAAEALQASEDWKHTTDELIALQAKWKEIGAVPRRYSEQIWKRFRAACDAFFEHKSKHFAGVESQYEENLQKKQALIEEMAAADIKSGGYDMIKEFQRRWSEIGYVPIKHKDSIQKSYKQAVDAMFAVLRGSEHDRSMNRFKERLQSMKGGGADKRLRAERERLYNKVRQLEQDIALLENNIGFFSKSKNADAMVADIREKIARSKRELQQAIEKVVLIDKENAAE
ncbi:MAG: DUF349 domain-containing protein [Rikenellaceae bacterium]|nr:DUF349 domain-containing protein [Rikenellaceae bacterium]